MTWLVIPETPDLVRLARCSSTRCCGGSNVCVHVAIATVFNNANQHINVYGDDVEVDYRGYEVS